MMFNGIVNLQIPCDIRALLQDRPIVYSSKHFESYSRFDNAVILPVITEKQLNLFKQVNSDK